MSDLSQLTFRLTGPALALGARPDLVLNELGTLGATNITASTDDMPTLAELDPDTCCLTWTMSVPATVGKADIEDVFLFVDAEWTLETADDTGLAQEVSPLQQDASAAGMNTPAPAATAATDAEASVRVPAARLDTLMDSFMARNAASKACAVNETQHYAMSWPPATLMPPCASASRTSST